MGKPDWQLAVLAATGQLEPTVGTGSLAWVAQPELGGLAVGLELQGLCCRWVDRVESINAHQPSPTQ
jgi:hypothetical protein